ncbi:uncharacterized protein LOC111367048 [Olea europaea subsp. europaea]|uniref:Uncharacterized protein LOC111367048 n=2 Tax=Olea europaea subsp. europaea TaxID=158383 RepID=A0A8S0PLD4_OLEEU|nr:uncharacterized protein LOC111367048 [Olea europaea subsp. europaea]
MWCFPGSWNISPGDRNAKRDAAIIGVAKSFILNLRCFVGYGKESLVCWRTIGQNTSGDGAVLHYEEIRMADWGPVLIGVILFILLQPGLLFQLPGNNRQLEFGSMKTNGKAIAVHTLIFFALYAILILAVHVHIYTG